MAEGIVNFVVGKLADVTVREVLSLYRVDAQVETVRRELGRMQAFLKDADKKLLNESTKRRIVVSIWGAGGIGKTTLTQKVYNRSMVDVKSRSIIDGSIRSCSIHDLLRDLAVRKAKEDNFLVVYSHPDDKRSIGGVRHLAIHHLDCEELMMSQNLRTLLCFCNGYMPNCSKQRLLKVVSTGTKLTGQPSDTKIKLKMFEGLTQLRYLGLIGQPSDKDQVCLEKVIGVMKFLQKAKA